MILWSFVFVKELNFFKLNMEIKSSETLRENWYLGRFECGGEKSSSLLIAYCQNWWSYDPLNFFFFFQKIKIMAVEERNKKFPKIGNKMWYLGRFECDKEKSSSLLVVYFQNWWSYDSFEVLFFCQKIQIMAKSKREIQSSRTLEKNVICG